MRLCGTVPRRAGKRMRFLILPARPCALVRGFPHSLPSTPDTPDTTTNRQGAEMPDTLLYAMEATLNGLTAGIMYALVALGFVLIFKASGIFNFSQGVMALFAALTLVGFQTGQVPFAHLINAVFGTRIHHFGWNMPTLLAIPATIAVMILFAWLVERIVLRHLVNQEPIILFMATIGLAYFLEGLGDIMWGAEVKRLDVGIPQGMSGMVDDLTFNWFGY